MMIGGPMPAWLLECWIEYSISLVVMVVRLALRTHFLGFRGWQGDDYLVVSTIIFYTLYVTTFQVEHDRGSNTGLKQKTADSLTDAQKHSLYIGSIWHFLAFFVWTGCLWSMKASVLFIYSRLTMEKFQHVLVKISAVVVVLTWIGAWLSSALKCGIPVSRNWMVDPVPPKNCPAGGVSYLYVGPTNCLTDLMILMIPLPLLKTVKKMRRKTRWLVYCMFASGFLTVTVCLLRFVFSMLSLYNIGAEASNLGFRLSWSSRENITSVLVVNVPIIYGCLQGMSRGEVQRRSVRSKSVSTNRNTTLASAAVEPDLEGGAANEDFGHEKNVGTINCETREHVA